jgi:hypothetical protein
VGNIYITEWKKFSQSAPELESNENINVMEKVTVLYLPSNNVFCWINYNESEYLDSVL